MKSKELLFWLPNILIPLVLGGIYYVCFRPDTYVSQIVYRFFLFSFMPSERCPDYGICRFFNCYLADILWAYALTFSVSLVMRHNKRRHGITLLSILLFEGIIEFMQRFPFMAGTFDGFDILLEYGTTMLALLIIITHEKSTKQKERQEKET